MKKILLIALLLSQTLFSQEETVKKDRTFSFNHQLFFFINNHTNFGDNFLSKANEPQFFGFGTQYNFIKFYDFKVGAGYDIMKYKVTDESLAGNISTTNYSNLFLKIQYEYNVSPKWTVEPNIGIGRPSIHQKTGQKSYGRFYGTSYSLGTNISYELMDHIAIFGGVNYNYSGFKVTTAKEYMDFFEKSNQIQVALGLIFSVQKKP